jgi:hypothetical protein
MVASLAVFVVTGIAGAAAAAEERAAAAVAAVAVDGSAADWRDVAPQASETEPKRSAIAQDDTFVYGYFESRDLALARRLLRSGAIFWINVSGLHGEGYGLRFRGTEELQAAVDAAAASQGGSPGRRDGQGETSRRAPLGAVEVIKNGAVIELITAGARDGGPAAACSFRDGVLVCEYRAPIAEIGLPSDGERAVAIGFQMGGRTEAERAAGAARQAWSRPGGDRQGSVPPPPARQESGEAAPATGAAGGDAAAPGASGQAAAGGGARRRAYPTIWHDVKLVSAPSAPPAAAR